MITYAYTSKGHYRSNNEDTILVDQTVINDGEISLESNQILIVADGVGGNKGGKIASQLVCELFSKSKIQLDQESISSLLMDINQKILDNQTYSLENMATTIAGIMFDDTRFIAFNLGDSDIYRYRNQILWKISISDKIKNTHFITNCLGMTLDSNEIHFMSGDIQKNDLFLLCSDGLSDVVTPIKLEEEIEKNILEDDLGFRLVELAYQLGTKDNVSIIIARKK